MKHRAKSVFAHDLNITLGKHCVFQSKVEFFRIIRPITLCLSDPDTVWKSVCDQLGLLASCSVSWRAVLHWLWGLLLSHQDKKHSANLHHMTLYALSFIFCFLKRDKPPQIRWHAFKSIVETQLAWELQCESFTFILFVCRRRRKALNLTNTMNKYIFLNVCWEANWLCVYTQTHTHSVTRSSLQRCFNARPRLL